MVNLMDVRRRIIGFTPHIDTATGSFTTDLSTPLTQLRIDFRPSQSGSGDPSPSNVRPISGYTGFTILNNGSSFASVTWHDTAGTVYGGYVDLASGTLVSGYKYIRLDANAPCEELRIQSNGLYTIWSTVTDMKSGTHASDPCVMCDRIVKVASRTDKPTTTLQVLFGANNRSIYLYYMNNVYGYTTKQQITAWLSDNPVYATIPLATPMTYQLSPQQIKTLIGSNALTCTNATTITASYWTH